jgi:CheY-like chemotaxis protein
MSGPPECHLKAIRASSPEAAPGTGRRVLLVDDEPLIRRAVTRILRRRCDIRAAASGEEAAALIAAGETFDLLLVDVVMPGWTGLDLYRHLQRTAPAAASRVSFFTGRTCDDALERQLEESGRPQVPKPFDVDELLALLERTPPATDGAPASTPAPHPWRN